MKKIYLSPERRPAPHGPYFGYPTLFEHDVTTSIAQKTAVALTRCGFSVKMAPPAARRSWPMASPAASAGAPAK